MMKLIVPRADDNLMEVDDEMYFPVGSPLHQPEISENEESALEEEGTDTNL